MHLPYFALNDRRARALTPPSPIVFGPPPGRLRKKGVVPPPTPPIPPQCAAIRPDNRRARKSVPRARPWVASGSRRDEASAAGETDARTAHDRAASLPQRVARRRRATAGPARVRPASRRPGGLRKGRPVVVAVEHPGLAVPHPCGDGQRNCAIVIRFHAEYASVAWKAGQRVGVLTLWIENNEPSVRAGFLALRCFRCFRCGLQRPADESGHRSGLAASIAQSDLHPGRCVRTARMRAFKRPVSGTHSPKNFAYQGVRGCLIAR
jgi:hypothetical protein